MTAYEKAVIKAFLNEAFGQMAAEVDGQTIIPGYVDTDSSYPGNFVKRNTGDISSSYPLRNPFAFLERDETLTLSEKMIDEILHDYYGEKYIKEMFTDKDPEYLVFLFAVMDNLRFDDNSKCIRSVCSSFDPMTLFDDVAKGIMRTIKKYKE